MARHRAVGPPARASAPASDGRLRAGVAALSLLCACTASIGSEGGPSVGVAGVAVPGERGVSAESALREQLRDELEALFRAERRYFALHATYTDEIYALQGDGAGPYQPPPEIRVRIPAATEEGFSAIASRAHVECALRVGDVPPPRSYAAAKGVIACRP